MDAAELVVAELFTNTIRHGKGSVSQTRIDLTFESGVVLLEVHGVSGEKVPERRSAGPEEQSGRGLDIVEMLARSWGWQVEGDGVRVWALLALDAAAYEWTGEA